MTYYQRAKDLFAMIEQGKLIEALDQFYHENVIIVSDNGHERKGKAEVKIYDEIFLKEIDEIYGGGILTITSDEKRKITMVEFWINIKFKNATKKKIQEVAIQQWDGDFIIKESFYSKR